jgi:hypothetical protein
VKLARGPKFIIKLIMVEPNEWPKQIEDPFEFNYLVFDDLMESLRSRINPEKEIHLIEDRNLRVGNGAILNTPIRLELRCPQCAERWTTENGVAKMFLKY